jgi:hypothetical protein
MIEDKVAGKIALRTTADFIWLHCAMVHIGQQLLLVCQKKKLLLVFDVSSLFRPPVTIAPPTEMDSQS